MKPLTIIDIARLAGVGKSTVSRVLNKDSRVSEKTRQKVLAVMEEQDFRPSRQARSMRSGKSKTIGVIVSRLDSPSENRAVRGILEAIYERDYDVVLMESHFCEDTLRKNAELLAQKQVEGVIIMALPGLDYEYLHAMPYPVVMMAQRQAGFTSIVYDDYGSIEKIMGYLSSEKIEKVAFIGVSEQDLTTGQCRLQAYKDNCSMTGRADVHFLGDLGYRSGYELAPQALATNPDAIVCASDSIAMGVHKCLMENDRTAIVVAGVGNNEMIRFLYPHHISVKLSYKQSGLVAMDVLGKKIAGQSAPDITVMPCELVT